MMREISRTALSVGLMRALHRSVDVEPWVVDDPVSPRLFGDELRAELADDPAWRQDAYGNAMRGYVLVRSAFAEDRLRAAVARGVRQAVVLGAGFDTFAYRQPPWMSGAVVYEVDAAPTQTEKRRLLARAGIPEPANVRYVPIDFETTALGTGLAAAGFDLAAPAFFSWLGVLPYLTRDAIDAVFAFVAALPPQSEIAFTFAPHDRSEVLARRVAEMGEPFRTTFDPAELRAYLRQAGFARIDFLTPEEARAYLGERRDELRIAPRLQIASAVLEASVNRGG
jgi:methyltransferase (TIGR00027 family)